MFVQLKIKIKKKKKKKGNAKFCINTLQNHRIMRLQGMEELSGDHLVQPTAKQFPTAGHTGRCPGEF